MIYEGFVENVNGKLVDVRVVGRGGVLPNCGLGTLGAAGWKPKRDDPVLVAVADSGRSYVISRLDGLIPKVGFHVGNESDGLTVTEQGNLVHTKDESKTVISDKGFEGNYKKFDLNGLGVKVKYDESSFELTVTQKPSGTEHKITITDKILIEGPSVHFGGDGQGGMILGDKWVAMKKEEWEELKGHTHPGGAGETGPSTQLQSYGPQVEQKAKDCQSEQVKNAI